MLSLVRLCLVLEVRTRNWTGLSITLVSYMDGIGLGTVMVGVWFLSDCSPLFLIIRLQNIYRQSFYGWILPFPWFLLITGILHRNGSMIYDHHRLEQTRPFSEKGCCTCLHSFETVDHRGFLPHWPPTRTYTSAGSTALAMCLLRTRE